MRVLGVSGSVRGDSHNTRLLRRAGELLPEGWELEVHQGLPDIPPYSQDEDPHGERAVEALREAIARADAVLFATPEYNHSIPGQLKNALDWISRPREESAVANKPAMVLSASTGQFGGVWARAELGKVLGAMGARVIEADFALPKADDAWTESGELADAVLEATLGDSVAALIAAVEASLALAA